MCLAKVYIQPKAAVTAGGEATGGATLLIDNVTRLAMDGDRIGLTSLLGATREVTGRIVSMDFMEGRLLLEGAETS